MPPRVTVIIATYNWSSVLPYSIASVLEQTFADFELLVVGDGCTDDSAEVVNAIGDPRVRWIDLQPRTGHQFGPNNEGMRQARGEFIAYLGHDDLWLPHHLASALAALGEGFDVAHSIVARIGPEGVPVEPYRVQHQPGGWLPPSSLVHRKRVPDTVGLMKNFRELHEPPEAEFLRRAHLAGFRFVQVPRLTVIKFPAAIRRDVYVTRPAHEQAAWLERIRANPGLVEVLELANIVSALSRTPAPTLAQRVWRRLLAIGRLWKRKGARIEETQRFKGIR
jgi:glycosyltransferase involved in cell wall biosynthesis